MAWRLARCGLLACLPLVILISLGCLPPGGSAMGLPKPQPNVNFTIAVEGAVWCKTCRYPGYVASKDASPLPNAVAVLRCRRGKKWSLTEMSSTDESGYFQVQTTKQVRAVTSKDCSVYVTSPVRACGVAVKPARNKGSPLKFRKFVPLDDGMQALYTAGDFLFGPKDPSSC